MDVEDHVGRMKTDRCIRVCCQVVKQLLCFGHHLLLALCLLACNHTECHEHCEVVGASVIQDASNDTLNVLDVGIAEGGRRVRREGTLGFAWVGEHTDNVEAWARRHACIFAAV